MVLSARTNAKVNRKHCDRPTNVFTQITLSSLNAIEFRERSMARAKVCVSKSHGKLIMISLVPRTTRREKRKSHDRNSGPYSVHVVQVRITCSHISMFPFFFRWSRFVCACLRDTIPKMWPSIAVLHQQRIMEFCPTHSRTIARTPRRSKNHARRIQCATERWKIVSCKWSSSPSLSH